MGGSTTRRVCTVTDKKGKEHHVDERIAQFIEMLNLEVLHAVKEIRVKQESPRLRSELQLIGGGFIYLLSYSKNRHYILFYSGNPAKVPPRIFKVNFKSE